MRIIFTVFWAAVLFTFTCSINFQALLHQQLIDFRFNPAPDWSELFRMDFQWYRNDWILRKAGHLIGFFVLALSASNFGKIRFAFILCILYAAATEILQLYFFRGGRIYDVINDSFGIILAYLVCKLFFSRKYVNSSDT
ncbi:VanZ family protein [Paenibacillus lemnae]|uniref:VanZ family protein n=1 Tax=Paenibacillus lemnae TaxID=1330551 RepID=A0A848M6I1_PAELE|nr:VanZ family protein [Paenibacillus lemnae]NMO95702.1 VanZ family protein [Paenibacillus lemnae]